jgi:hypothetical protein
MGEKDERITLRLELARLLQQRTLSNWERRKRRLQRIPIDVVLSGLVKARNGEPLTLEEYIASHLGFLPGELESMRERDAAEQSEPAAVPASLSGLPVTRSELRSR